MINVIIYRIRGNNSFDANDAILNKNSHGGEGGGSVQIGPICYREGSASCKQEVQGNI